MLCWPSAGRQQHAVDPSDQLPKQATALPACAVLTQTHTTVMLLCTPHRGGDVVQDAKIGEQLVVVVALKQPQLARGHGKAQRIVGLQRRRLVNTPAL